jgi:hypothetical protein
MTTKKQKQKQEQRQEQRQEQIPSLCCGMTSYKTGSGKDEG